MFYKKDLKILEKISNGPFWDTFVVSYSTEHEHSRKFFELRAMKKQKIVQMEEEIRVIKESTERGGLWNVFICNQISIFQDFDNCFFVSELPYAGYLYFYLRRAGAFPLPVATFFIAEIFSALQYLHSRNILYRLLTPENIMVTEKGHIKLRFDFLNKIGLTHEKFEENVGYIPIDYLREGSLSVASDYWSAGIILYELLFGINPFEGANPRETLHNIMRKRVIFPIYTNVCVENLILRLLDKFEFRRLGHARGDWLALRRHSFFYGLNWSHLENCRIKSPLITEHVDIFDKNGVDLSDVYCSEYKEGQVDGYGETFSDFRSESNIRYRSEI